jgi:sigma-B regulation protein RsbU (phosphoserine phosphatase)
VTAIPATPLPRETGRQIAALEHLLEVARQLGASVELDPLLEVIATAATTVLDCERATVFLYDTSTEELYSRVATGIEDSAMTEIRFPASRGIAGEVARTGNVITLADAYADPRFNPDFDRQSGFRTRTMLAFPLRGYDSKTVGVLQVLNKRSGQFNHDDEQLVNFLGAQAGVAIQRQMLLQEYADKQRIQRELNIARSIQQGLLPREQPTVAGYDIAGWNQPADETGGDSFDFLPLNDGNLAIALADATGHGIGAALIMAETRALFRATVRQTTDLPRVMTEINDLLCIDLPDGKFNTAFFGFLDPRQNTVRFLSAGQGPILVYAAATGEVSELETHGLPLGLMPEAEYDDTTLLQLAPGDMLVLLTDGFYEWDRPDGEQFGTERIADLIRQHHHLPAAEFIQVVYRSVVEFSAGTRQGDDLTAVIVRREPAG